MKRLLLITILFVVYILIQGCCNPDKPVAILSLEHSTGDFDLKGFDCNCNGTIDYWQHYENGKEFGSRKYDGKGEPTLCEKK